MLDTARMKKAAALRIEADKLEREAVRPLPDKWQVGMRVRFLRNTEWAWGAGSEATVVELSDECASRRGDEYQVFWTTPDCGGSVWWTTPNDVELVLDDGGAIHA